MVRKLLACAALAALLASPYGAQAQLVTAAGQTGAVGSIITATDPNGHAQKVVEPHYICDSGCVSTQTDSTGSAYVNTEGRKASYSAQSNSQATISGDNWCIQGSATKTVRITSLAFEIVGSATALTNVNLILRSSADTGGTSAIATNVPLDSTSAAGTAVARQYSVAPTTGTTVGTLQTVEYLVLTTTSPPFLPQLVNWQFGTNNTQELVLRGTTQQVCVNLGAPFTAAYWNATWTEE